MAMSFGPDYAHIIWMPQQWPAKEEGGGTFGSLMSGLGSGVQQGSDFKKASAAWKAAEAKEPGSGGKKPSFFGYLFGEGAGGGGGGGGAAGAGTGAGQQPAGTIAPATGSTSSTTTVNTAQAAPFSMQQETPYPWELHDKINQLVNSQQAAISNAFRF